MHLAIYAHPFDLDALSEHGGLQRLVDVGVREVALAVSYHAGRWLAPWQRGARVRYLEDGTVHFRPGSDYGVLRPQPSSAVDPARPSPLERLCEQAPRAGLSVRAWTVGTHNSRLGRAHPELCVENAFGDRYTHALCPSQPAVQEYLRAVLEDLGAHEGLGSIELEAFGWMGWKHSSHHDKSSFAPKGLLDYALSLCFCAACRERLVADQPGADPDAVRDWARAQVRRDVEDGDAMAPAAAADPIAEEAGFEPARASRITTLSQLGRALRQSMPPGIACAVQVHPKDLFTGSQMPLRQTPGFRPEEYVLTAYGEDAAGARRLLDGETMFLIEKPDHRKRLCIWPKAPQFTSDDDLVAVRELAAERGIGAIAIYHLGLLPWRTIERAARILSA